MAATNSRKKAVKSSKDVSLDSLRVGEVVRFGLFNYVLSGIRRLSDGSAELSFTLASDSEDLADKLGFRVQETYKTNPEDHKTGVVLL